MEDISRELEREIAQSKPKPFKKAHHARILIVDDFGQIKSGAYLNRLLRFLALFAVVFLGLTLLFFSRYLSHQKENRSLIQKLAKAETRIDQLSQEKERLMARLVISGQEIGFETDTASRNTDGSKLDEEKITGAVAKP